ncbi:MAG: hypothetical protein R3D59_12060 [Paracoccaceae bacterium]
MLVASIGGAASISCAPRARHRRHRAGVALILAYLTGWSFGPVFFTINIPLYVLARGAGPGLSSRASPPHRLARRGAETSSASPRSNPAAAAVLFGVSAGVGLLGLFRHAGSLGGVPSSRSSCRTATASVPA